MPVPATDLKLKVFLAKKEHNFSCALHRISDSMRIQDMTDAWTVLRGKPSCVLDSSRGGHI